MALFDAEAMAGKKIMITGASSGLGRATALLLGRLGARLVLNGRDTGRLEETRSALAGEGHVALAAPLEDADQVADLVKQVSVEHGELDGIFHAAGTELVRPMRMTKRAQIDTLFASSVQAALGIARAASQKAVLADGASVLFMSSAAGSRATPGMVAYSAAKAAIDAAARSLAAELAPRRIRVNSLVAGAVVTEMHERLSATLNEEGLADYEGRHLLGFGSSEDVANAAAFLLSDAARWITGTALVVDGGYTAR